MNRNTLCVAALSTAVLLAAGARGQSGRKVQAVDLRPLSVTAYITVEEYDKGKVVASRSFVYQLYFKDDGAVATTQPIVSAFKLKHYTALHFDHTVKADPREELRWVPAEAGPGFTLLRAPVSFDPTTGLPDHKVGGCVVRDKNGNHIVLSLRVLYRDWKRRRVEVQVLDDEP